MAYPSSTPATGTTRKNLIGQPIFLGLFGLLTLALFFSFYVVLIAHPDAATGVHRQGQVHDIHNLQRRQQDKANNDSSGGSGTSSESTRSGPHLNPRVPILPIFAEVPNGDQLMQETLSGKNPTMAGIVAILQRFVRALHLDNLQRAQEKAETDVLIESYFQLTKKYLAPLDEAYRGKAIFPIREDESIFISLAAFREQLLAQTLKSAFDQAKDPDKLFIGAVVQNCFGNDGRQCRTGLQVIGKNDQGRDMVKMSDAPPDENGIEVFCQDAKYKKYCDAGHIRVLYVHDTDALGPATARYYASKLWGGESYVLQMDAHLEFAPSWDQRYIQEVKAAKNFPKAILSSYPPGFQEFGHYQGGSPGARLCTCEFSTNQAESHILRINTRGTTPKDAPRPTQIAFIAAGFFFARAEFLKDVPFDPYVPWCFMGEEIALSMRAWTAGWNIYAPRQNLIAHQYRPGRMGLPKFWESVGRDSGRPGLNTRLQNHVIRRIKHLVGYPEDTVEAIGAGGDGIVLTDKDHYGLGTERTREAYLELTKIDPGKQQCHPMDWCANGLLE